MRILVLTAAILLAASGNDLGWVRLKLEVPEKSASGSNHRQVNVKGRLLPFLASLPFELGDFVLTLYDISHRSRVGLQFRSTHPGYRQMYCQITDSDLASETTMKEAVDFGRVRSVRSVKSSKVSDKTYTKLQHMQSRFTARYADIKVWNSKMVLHLIAKQLGVDMEKQEAVDQAVAAYAGPPSMNKLCDYTIKMTRLDNTLSAVRAVAGASENELDAADHEKAKYTKPKNEPAEEENESDEKNEAAENEQKTEGDVEAGDESDKTNAASQPEEEAGGDEGQKSEEDVEESDQKNEAEAEASPNEENSEQNDAAQPAQEAAEEKEEVAGNQQEGEGDSASATNDAAPQEAQEYESD